MKPVLGLVLFVALAVPTAAPLCDELDPGQFRPNALASYYGENPRKEGLTPWFADGSRYDKNKPGIASRDIPLGTSVLLIYRREGQPDRYVITQVIDWGPAEWTGRNIDLHLPTARALGFDLEKGQDRIYIKALNTEVKP